MKPRGKNELQRQGSQEEVLVNDFFTDLNVSPQALDADSLSADTTTLDEGLGNLNTISEGEEDEEESDEGKIQQPVAVPAAVAISSPKPKSLQERIGCDLETLGKLQQCPAFDKKWFGVT